MEVLLGVLLALAVIAILYVCFGCEKPRPGGKR